MPNKIKSGQRILITSALPYVNNVPHLGNIIGCVLSADVFARYCRARGYETIYICGADEHGTATETKALEEGLTPKQICDKYYKIHKDIYEWFNCSFSIFGRTSTKAHMDITQDIFKQLHKKGYIVEGMLEQTFCTRCNRFLADRYVEGTCPHCGYGKARGDQCDKCGKLLNPTELKEARCKICGSQPIIKESKHLFLDLPKIGSKLKVWVDKQSKAGSWPQNAITITNAWFHEGLKQRCITRDLTWGVPVPLKGYGDKVFYVWFDAPIGYISITASLTDKWKGWWQPSEGKANDVQLYQFMAKDNIPFHSILFPATLLGTGDPWTMVHHIASVEYLNYESGKFSKSNKQGVFGDDAMKSGIPADVWRYYLLHNRPEASDSEFSWTDFQEKNNHELLANVGNLVNRTLIFIGKYCGGKVPSAKLNMEDKRFVDEINTLITGITQHLEEVKLKDSLKLIMQIGKMGNAYFQNHEPWKLIKEDPDRCNSVLHVCVNLVKLLSTLLEPFIPETAKEIRKQLRLKEIESSCVEWPEAFDLNIASGHKIGEPKPLFRKIEDAEIQKLKGRFSGKQVVKTPCFTVTAKAATLGIKAAAAILDVDKITNKSSHLDGLQKHVFTLDDEGYVALHKKVGAEENTSLRWLSELMKKNGKLPNINTLVDAYNIVSLRHNIAAGAHNVSAIHGNVRVDVCTGTERYTELGTHSARTIKRGEYAAIDDEKVICRLELKQCEETKVLKNTNRVLLYYEGHENHTQQQVTDALLEACELIKVVCGGNYKIIYPLIEGNVGIDPFSHLDLRVAKIVDIAEHPSAEKLYVLQLDVGKEKRQLVAGLRVHYTKDELQGKHIVIIANLKPALLRGIESQGMLLAGQEGSMVRVLETKATPGTQVTVAGIVQHPAKQLDIDQFLAVGLKVEKGIPSYKGKKLMAGKDIITIKDVKEGSIR